MFLEKMKKKKTIAQCVILCFYPQLWISLLIAM